MLAIRKVSPDREKIDGLCFLARAFAVEFRRGHWGVVIYGFFPPVVKLEEQPKE
jgi:hypothetical protein